GSADEGGRDGFGLAATDEEIRAWNSDLSPTGEGLPSGQGTVKQGAQVFAAKCAMCHGPTGTEGPKDRLVGGQGTLTTAKPVKTIGSYWPYATTLYDFINRAMPFNAPGSLKPGERYLVIAWLLFHHGIAKEVGLPMRPAQLLIFGNPKAGTPLMIVSPSIAIDLPLKALAWEDGDGKVWLSYNKPEYLKERHGIPKELLKNISAIEALAEKAV